MHVTKEFKKKTFLKQFLLGLHVSNSISNPISIQQRKNSIKLSADLAMAFARGRTHWTHALITKLGQKEENKSTLKGILGRRYEILMARYSCPLLYQKVQRRKKSVTSYRFSYNAQKRRSSALKGSCVRVSPSVVARNLENRRTKVLKRLVPGGEFLNGSSLLSEALDYVISLKAQVDMMKSLWRATQVSSSSNVELVPSAPLQKKDASCTIANSEE
ncbi:basic helix-loop-helix (bHLH) DNA-binding superfamily protein [Rhynchospora pubera]|uniref:Basic helix-loop-helix (BHLH) DNA-binding superfamily protein n=1 Tax=Rhynchospora pubera TaxID=906938 RepID=A0AAV8D6A9_9POAL|nr:basic helix-loop-helix (bHLH) DNA-binding superfamily protein [Rhynchospora pubera]KAJ4792028.1 basic helix-loop-helix (bHLH) DNA-binding superfamily protein [Rhynchospora pubera]